MTDVQPDSTLISPPPSKKLRQARLPFKVIPTKEVQTTAPLQPSPASGKKRKLSDSATGPSKASKTPRNDENVPRTRSTPARKVDDAENEVSSSSETDAQVKAKLDDKNVQEKPKKSKLLEKFVRKTQQGEVSTTNTVDSSGIIDLTASNDSCPALPSKSNDQKTEDLVENETENSSKEDTSEKSSTADDKQEVAPEEAEKAEKKETSVSETKENIENEESANDSMVSVSSLDDSMANDTSANEASTPSRNNLTKSAKKKSASAKEAREAEKQKRKEEKEKARLEKQKEKEEKERQRKEEKEKKDKEREDLKKKKEQERKEKLEQKEKERLEKLKQKEEEKRVKEEERLQKLEQKKKELEEKQRQKEEQEKEKQRLKEEKEKEKQKELEEKNKVSNMQKETFKSFFTKKEKVEPAEKVEEVNGRFLQFEIKKDMRVAPVRRAHTETFADFDALFLSQDCEKTYLKQIKEKDYAVRKSAKTWPSDEDEIICMEDQDKPSLERMKVKFLKFHENYRPPYYGTWRKKSKYVSARNPLGKDTVQLDYEVDSDDEWEEEEPGESLSDCEKDKDEEEDNDDDDDEDDDGFFVPHGYLSEGEGCEDDEEEVNPEKLKMRQMAKAKRWESEMNAKVAALRAVCIGCMWWNPTDEPRTPEYDELKKYQAVPLMSLPISTETIVPPKEDKNEAKKKRMEEINKKRRRVPEEAIPDLIRLVHGNQWSIQKLLSEFREFWKVKQTGGSPDSKDESINTSKTETNDNPLNTSQDDTSPNEFGLSKGQIERTIREIATYDKGSSPNCWLVHKEILEKHGLSDLPIPNQWKWVTKQPGKKRKAPTPTPGNTPEPGSTPVPKDPKESATPKDSKSSDIKKFAVAGQSPKIPPKEIKNVKEIKETANISAAKEANSPSIRKFAKPGLSPKFPVLSPKPVKGDQVSPMCSTPKANAKSLSKFSADTPKRETNKAIEPSSLFQATSANTSINSEKEEDNDISLVKIEPAKSDKNQPTLMQMFAKKPPSSGVKTQNSKNPKEKVNSPKPEVKINSPKPVVANTKQSDSSKTGADLMNISGVGTEESPMEID